MSKSKRRNAFSGTVLIMILTVMVVLIIMLMATLTVVSTAGQRIYTKYEENQAYYTARSALDVFTDNMFSDAAYIAYDDSGSKRQFEYTNPDGSGDASTDMKQGLALQLDLYKIKSQNEDGIDLQYIENAVLGDATFASGSKEEVNYTLSSAAGLPYIEYEVTLPKTSDGSNEYGKIVDIDINDEDGDGDRTEQIARIKVEVLDRRYATSPSYTMDQLKRYFEGDSDQTGCPADDTALKTAIANGPRNKDYMKIKITSKVKMMGVEGEAIVIFETTEKDAPANDQALTTSGTASGRGGSSPNVQGGFATMAPDSTKLVSGDDVTGTIFSLGSFETDTTTNTLTLSEGSALVALNGLSMPSSSTTIKATDENRFMFLGGTSQLYGPIGDATNGISTIADTIETGSSTLNYYGNIYANTIKLSNSQATVNGNTYANNIVLGNEWSSLYLDGEGNIVVPMSLADAFNQMNLTLNDGFEIKSADGSIIIDSTNIDSVVCENGRTLTYSTGSFAEIDFSTDPAVGSYSIVDNDGKLYRKYDNLPFQIDGQNSVEIPTPQSYFKDYYIEDAFNPASGDLGKYDSDSDTIDYTVTDPDVIYDEDNNVAYLLKSGATLLEDYIANSDAEYTKQNSIAGVVSSKSIPVLTDTGETIDLSGDDVYYKLSGTYYSPIKVTGNKGRLILLIEEGDSVKFDGIGSGFSITTDYIYDTTMTITNGVTKAPKVDIYGGTNSNLELGNHCTVAGYVMMPTGDIKIENGLFYDFTYGNNTSTTDNVCWVGSIFCRSFDAGNHPAILFLDKDSGAETPGEPHLLIQASQYTRK